VRYVSVIGNFSAGFHMKIHIAQTFTIANIML